MGLLNNNGNIINNNGNFINNGNIINNNGNIIIWSGPPHTRDMLRYVCHSMRGLTSLACYAILCYASVDMLMSLGGF